MARLKLGASEGIDPSKNATEVFHGCPDCLVRAVGSTSGSAVFGASLLPQQRERGSAQTSKKRGSLAGNEVQKDRSKTPAKTEGGQNAQAAKAPGGASEPSAAYQESLRQTVERRRQRRRAGSRMPVIPQEPWVRLFPGRCRQL